MIIDSIENRSSYNGISPYFDEAFAFALTLADKEPGRYDCDAFPAGKVYAVVQEGDTQPFEDGLIEAHRRYMDVQIMLGGGEAVWYTDIKPLHEEVPYDEEKDIIFFEKSGQPVQILPGMFYAVLPQDGHMPCRNMNGASNGISDRTSHYRKIVLKIAV